MGRSGKKGLRAAWAVALAMALWVPAAGRAAEIRVFTTAHGLPSDGVTALAATPDGTLWIGTGDAGVYLLDPLTGKGKGYRASDGLASDRVISIALFDGKVYAGTSGGLSVFDGSAWTTISGAEGVTFRNVRLAVSPDGKELWACSVYLNGGTVRFDGKAWTFVGGEGRGLFNDIQGFAFLSGDVLLASGSGVPYLYRGGAISALRDGLPAANIFSAGTRDGRWLLGTSKGLLEYRNGWKAVSLPEGFSGVPVFSVASRGNTVVAASRLGLVKVDSRGSKSLTPQTGLPSPRVHAATFVGEAVAAGTSGGLALIRNW